ncbi:TetR family transcriptional regulator C-terminal domain-containing protein [Nocardia albiluteola]|uniref:TetR family transcriptional regulator C-terminal domain-containing protein n=1 Tax=Nocardia albiluteola TaxID=2842303 RepID=UPI0027E20661|nr:TetR family transcriptional regulator C-terminal domain-containing protein [Nocardia albiluteola]
MAQGVAAGEFRTADPRGAAWRLTAMLDGLAVQRVALDEAVTRTDIENWMLATLAAELREQFLTRHRTAAKTNLSVS